MKHYHSYVNGQFVTDSADWQDVDDPATGQIIARVDCLDAMDVQKAIDAAKTAQSAWSKLPSQVRAQHVQQLADALVKHTNDIGEALALESGKSMEDACNEVVYAAEVTRYHAEWARRIEGEVIPSDSRNENLLLLREPMGVVACLIPFNYPIYTLMRKIAPALIAGNSVLVRPSANTPSSALALAQAVHEADLPSGLVNIMCMSHDSAQLMCTHSAVSMIAMTGSVGAGRHVLEYCKTNFAKPSLELGGKTPAIIADDADLEAAANALVASKTTNAGQLCTAIERVYVQAKVYDLFVELLTQKMQARQFGNRRNHPSHMGPLISAKARAHVHGIVERAVAAGATLAVGGYIPEGEGYFYPPTLLTNCKQKMEVVQEETFAPVMVVLSYQTIQEALDLSNDHQFGLASVLYTERYRDTMFVANHIEAGELYVNRTPADPYQGYHAGWKRSGLGGDDGKHGMLEFTQTRLVVMNW